MKAMLLELKTMFDNQFILEGGKLSNEVFALNSRILKAGS